MSDYDDRSAAIREEAERKIQEIISLRERLPKLTGKEVAKRVNWPVGRTQMVLARLVKYSVVQPAGAPRGSRQIILNLIDEKYGPKAKRK